MSKSVRLARPVCIEDVCERLANFRSPEATAALASHTARANDVYISTYAKSGTTWMQQIVHQLRSGGDTDFEEICCVVPWLESAVDIGIDPHASQPYSFRAFKCHLLYSDLPKGARYITVFRDPLKVLSSFYRFFEGWWFEPGSVSIDEFASSLYMKGSTSGMHWDHLVDWWPKVESADTLALCYEDMLQAPDQSVELVAEFLQLDISKEKMDAAKLNSSRDYMFANSHQFDEHVLRDKRDHIWGLPPGGSSGKVAGDTDSLEPSQKVLEQLDQIWRDRIERVLGFKNYQELRYALPDYLKVNREQ